MAASDLNPMRADGTSVCCLRFAIFSPGVAGPHQCIHIRRRATIIPSLAASPFRSTPLNASARECPTAPKGKRDALLVRNLAEQADEVGGSVSGWDDVRPPSRPKRSVDAIRGANSGRGSSGKRPIDLLVKRPVS